MAEVQVNFRAAEPTGLRKVYHTCMQTAKRPIEWIRYAWSPCENPSVILRRIKETADRGIQKAKANAIAFENRVSQINQELNQALHQRGVGENPGTKRAERGMVADLGPYPRDEEATYAIPLKDRAVRTDWKEDNLQKLIEKTAVFSALILMRNKAGIVEANNLKILSLVKQATEGANSISVWDLFTSHYELTFFQVLFAGFFYWLFYQTSLITNTIDAYLRNFIDDITKDLTTESRETRTKVFRALIENTNEFLTEDIKATKAYANEQERGLLKDIRKRAIQRHYGCSLRTLCENFSANLIAGDPRVRFFKDLQEIPIFGIVFWAFEWIVNKLIIQRLMMNSILPEVLEQGVTKGIEATNNLPFAISLTKFFTSQLEQLRSTIESDHSILPSKDSEVVPGTELLPPTIKLLIQALELEGEREEYTPLELRKKIAKFEKGGILDATLLPKIEKGIVEAGNTVFTHLNEKLRSGEFFANLLELSLAPFEEAEKTEKMLRAEFEEESRKFKTTASSVFQKLVKKAISGDTGGVEAQVLLQEAKDSLASQTILANELIARIDAISERINQKIAASLNAPIEENEIQGDLVELFEVIQIFDSRKEFQDTLDQIDGTHRNEIWGRIGPLFEKVEKMQAKILELQDVSDQYSCHVAVHKNLRKIKRYLQVPLIQSLKKSTDEISKMLGADALIPIRLNAIIQETTDLSTSVAREQNAIDALRALDSGNGEGFLCQLLDYQQGHPPREFRPRDCWENIEKYVNAKYQGESCFSEEERITLHRIIGNGSNIESKWGELGVVLQRIRAVHLDKKDQDAARLEQSLTQAKIWIDEKMFQYNYIKNKNYRNMQEKMREISSEIRILKTSAGKISPSLTLPLSTRIWKGMAVGAPFVGAYVGWPITGALLGSSAYKILQPSTDSEENVLRSSLKKAAKKAAQVGAAAIGSIYIPNWISSWLPGWEGAVGTAAWTATGTLAGASIVDSSKSAIEDHAFNRVWDIFLRAYSLSCNPRIYEAATTRAMQAIAGG